MLCPQLCMGFSPRRHTEIGQLHRPAFPPFPPSLSLSSSLEEFWRAASAAMIFSVRRRALRSACVSASPWDRAVYSLDRSTWASSRN